MAQPDKNRGERGREGTCPDAYVFTLCTLSAAFASCQVGTLQLPFLWQPMSVRLAVLDSYSSSLAWLVADILAHELAASDLLSLSQYAGFVLSFGYLLCYPPTNTYLAIRFYWNDIHRPGIWNQSYYPKT
ncbi:hypothetical protein V8F06_008237 [Rhypophila decipiens]